MATRTDSASNRSSIINGLEARLASSFKPVAPDGEFVKRLKNRLAANPSLVVENDNSSAIVVGLLGALIITAGLMLGKRLWRYLSSSEESD